MGNRPRLDPGILAEVKSFIADKLTANGELSVAERLLVAEMIGRSQRTVERYVTEVAGDLGLAETRSAVEATDTTPLEAFLNRDQFSFADHDMKRVCLAYAGNLRALHRDAVRFAETLGLSGPLSYPHLTRKFNADLPGNVRALIRRGIKGFKESSMYLRWSAGYRNEVWQIDATQMDLWVLPKGTSERTRPWALFIVDDYSRVILAATLMLHDYTAEDSAACVHRAMRMREITLPDGRIVEVGGKPEKILCDNAQQFTGQVLSHVAQTIGFVMWAVAVYAGEKKGKVERVVRAANEDFARRLPGYANRDLKTLSMRDSLHAANEDLRDEQQALDELGKWVEEFNHDPHPTEPGKSRYEVWADDSHGLERVDDELLRPATVEMPRSSYTYSKSGFRIQRDGHKFFYVDLSNTLDVKKRYLLRHLPGDTDWVDAYRLDGKFILRCFETRTLDQEASRQVEQDRRAAYRSIRSAQSEAVELRALANAIATDSDERPNPIAAAHQQTLAVSSEQMIRASLGAGPDERPALPGGDTDPGDTPPDAHPEPDVDEAAYDELAAEAVRASRDEQHGPSQ